MSVKPNAYSHHTSKIIETIIHKCFDEKYVAVRTGGRQENQALFASHFDKIFFTGSQIVGKEVRWSKNDFFVSKSRIKYYKYEN